MRHRAPTVMFAALAVSVLLVGCSSSDKPGAGKSPSGGGDASTVPSQQPTPASSSGASGSSVPSGPPSVDPSASSLAQAGRGAVPGLSVAILSLARSSVTMAFRATNTGRGNLNIGSSFIDPAIFNPNTASDAGGVALIDAPNNKKYLVLLDSAKNCICSKQLGSTSVDVGQSTVLFAEFPAPPATTKTVQVTFPHFPTVDGVPISGGA